MLPAGQNCGNCRFFDAVTGWCLRYPPWVITGSRERGDWPVTQPDWWCGEWKAEQE